MSISPGEFGSGIPNGFGDALPFGVASPLPGWTTPENSGPPNEGAAAQPLYEGGHSDAAAQPAEVPPGDTEALRALYDTLLGTTATAAATAPSVEQHGGVEFVEDEDEEVPAVSAEAVEAVEAPPEPPVETLPEGARETGEAILPDDPTVSVSALMRPSPESSDTPLTRERPQPGRLLNRLARDPETPIEASFSYDDVPGRAPIRINMPDSIVPRRAAAVPLEGERAEQTEQRDERFTHFVRLYQVIEPPKSEPDPTTVRPGIDLHGLSKARDPIQLNIHGVPLPLDEEQMLSGALGQEISGLSDTRSQANEAARLQLIQDELTQSRGTVPLTEVVTVGGHSREAAIRNAHVVAGRVMPVQDGRQWVVQENEQRQPIVYDTPQQAVAELRDERGIVDLSTIVSPQHFGELIRLPGVTEGEAALNGLPVREQIEFPVNQTFPEGTETVVVGSILNGDGEPVGEFRLSRQELKRKLAVWAASGFGKTVLGHRLMTQVKQDNPDSTTIAVDFQKEGVLPDSLARTYAGEGITGEAAHIHRVSARDGVWVDFSPMHVTSGKEMLEARVDAKKSIVSPIADVRTAQVVGKWTDVILNKIFTMSGRDPRTGDALFPHGTPKTPSMRMAVLAVAEVFADEEFSKDTGGDMVSAMRSTIADRLAAVAARFNDNMYSYAPDPLKFVTNGGTVVVEPAMLNEELPKQSLLRGVQQLTKDGLAQWRAQEGIKGDTNRMQVFFVSEESGGMYRESEPGSPAAEAADQARVTRGYGQADLFIDQIPDGISLSLLGNVTGYFIGHMPKVPANLIGRLGPTITERQIGAINTLPMGEFLYYGMSTPEGAVRVRIDMIQEDGDYPRETLRGPEAFVKTGLYSRLYEGKLLERAEAYLRDDPLGVLIHGLAQLNTYLAYKNADLITLTDSDNPNKVKVDKDTVEYMREQLMNMTGEDARLRDAAIEMAVANTVGARASLEAHAPHEEYAAHIRNDMLAQLTDYGLERSTRPRLDLAHPDDYYARARNKAVDAMTAPRMKMTRAEREAMGNVAGLTAEEQVSFIDRKVGTIQAQLYKQAVEAGRLLERNPATRLSKESVATMTQHVMTLAGGMKEPKISELLADRIIEQVYEQVAVAVTQSDGDRGSAAATALLVTDAIKQQVLASSDGLAHGLPGFKQRLLASIAEYEDADAIPMDDPDNPDQDMNALYKEKFLQPRPDGTHPDGSGRRLKARDQVKDIDVRQATHSAKNRRAANMSHDANILMGPDYINANGFSGLDNVLIPFMPGRKGQFVYERMQGLLYGKRTLNRDLVSSVFRNNTTDLNNYRDSLSLNFVYSHNFTLSPAATRIILDGVAGHTSELRGMRTLRMQEQANEGGANGGKKNG